MIIIVSLLSWGSPQNEAINIDEYTEIIIAKQQYYWLLTQNNNDIHQDGKKQDSSIVRYYIETNLISLHPSYRNISEHSKSNFTNPEFVQELDSPL